jgi:hypothetical protein
VRFYTERAQRDGNRTARAEELRMEANP